MDRNRKRWKKRTDYLKPPRSGKELKGQEKKNRMPVPGIGKNKKEKHWGGGKGGGEL